MNGTPQVGGEVGGCGRGHGMGGFNGLRTDGCGHGHGRSRFRGLGAVDCGRGPVEDGCGIGIVALGMGVG